MIFDSIEKNESANDFRQSLKKRFAKIGKLITMRFQIGRINMTNTGDEQAGKTRERPATRDATNGNRVANFNHQFFFVSRQITQQLSA